MGDTLVGIEFKRWLVGGAGSDNLIGNAGIDTLINKRATTTLSRSGGNVTDAQWQLKHGTEIDRLTGIERVEFSDYGIALDLDGNAGDTAKLTRRASWCGT